MSAKRRGETTPRLEDPAVLWRAFSVRFRPAATKSGETARTPSRMTDEELVWVSNVVKREIAKRVEKRGLRRAS